LSVGHISSPLKMSQRSSACFVATSACFACRGRWPFRDAERPVWFARWLFGFGGLCVLKPSSACIVSLGLSLPFADRLFVWVMASAR
jgi:hypothetical protein